MKTTKNMISILLILSILMSVLAIKASADAPDFKHEVCVDEHFSTIYGNIPQNVANSCVYTAASMLLSFYDTYWDDRFVPEKFEGRKGEINLLSGELINTFELALENTEWMNYKNHNQLSNDTLLASYRTFLNKNKDDYLHLSLINMGINLGYHNNVSTYEISANEIKNILEQYLHNVCGFTDEQVVVRVQSFSLTHTNDDVLNIAKSLAVSGHPAIYIGQNVDWNIESIYDIKDIITGHAMVSYKSDANLRNLKFHTGWINSNYDDIMRTNYTAFPCVIWLEINEDLLPHSCSDNYVSSDGSRTLCACEIYNMHPSHIHQVAKSYSSHDLETHTFDCLCGGQKIALGHKYYSYICVSNSIHQGVCGCGYVYSEQHNMWRKTPRYSVCVNCGYTRDHYGESEMIPLENEEDEETE